MTSALIIMSTTSLACSSLAILDKEKNVYQGRTMELSEELPSWLTFYPKNTLFQKKAPDGTNGIKYNSKYDILAISTEVYNDGDDHNILQGLNSAGLSFSLNMIDSAEINELNKREYVNSIPVTSIGEWALANFSNIDEVKSAVKSGHFWSPVLKDFGNLQSPFHYAFYDKQGNSIVVEALNGELHVYDNPTRAMTNGPDFSWHLKNLNNYSQLTNVDRSSSILGGIKVNQPDSGIASSQIPSSDTSVGRFIRAVYYSTYAPKADNPKEAINTLAHIMNRFDRTKNITIDTISESGNAGGKFESEYTVWTTLSDLTNGKISVKTYNEMNYKEYSINQFNQTKKPFFEKIN